MKIWRRLRCLKANHVRCKSGASSFRIGFGNSPGCGICRYYRSIIWKDCDRPGWKVVLDMLYLFFKLHIIPEHYADCRLWEHPRSEWVKYFGSPYTPVQWGRFAKRVFPFEYGVLYYDKLVGANQQRARRTPAFHLRAARA